MPASVVRGIAAVWVAAVILFGQVFHWTHAAAWEPQPPAQTESYRLGPADTLKVQVLDEPEFSDERILVRPDGMASFAGIGELQVAGQTLDEVKEALIARLQRLLVSPKVTLTLVSGRPLTLHIHGAVKQPGLLQFPISHEAAKQTSWSLGNLHLSQALAEAGGVLPNADISAIRITRTAFNPENHATETTSIVIDFWQLLKEGNHTQDPLLQPDDVVYVPESKAMALGDEEFELLLRSPIGPKEFPVRVLGEVQTPGLYYLDARSPFLNSALSKAGGFATRANKKAVAVRRFSDDRQFLSTLFIDPKKGEIYLRPNDVIFVAESRTQQSRLWFRHLADFWSPFQSFAITGASTAQIFGLGGWTRFSDK
jgi:protein involved in polysaccharide export with SLBB domain